MTPDEGAGAGSARALASPVHVCVCPDTLKNVLSAREAARWLAVGLRMFGVNAVELPCADGGEGTLEAIAVASGGKWHLADTVDAFGRPRVARWLELSDNTAVVEAAEAIRLDPRRLDPFVASSRGLGKVVNSVGRPKRLIVALGGTANVDGGAGLLEEVEALPAPTVVAYDVAVPLVDAARVFAAQKGANEDQVPELERRLGAIDRLAPYAHLPGAGAAGGLGAALAALGAELRPGADVVLDLIGFDPTGFDLVISGEGTVDGTTGLGKAPGKIVARCSAVGVPCLVFGGRVLEPLPGAITVALSGDPGRARADLLALGERIGRRLVALGGLRFDSGGAPTVVW